MRMADPAETNQAEADARTRRAEARRLWLTRLGAVVAVAAVLWVVWFVLVGRNEVSTDDAYVAAEVAQVTPLVSGSVTQVNVRDTQMVHAGDVLVQIDPVNARITLAQSEAQLAEARRRFRQTLATGTALSAGTEAAAAQLAAAVANSQKAMIDLKRREALAGNGAVSGEELTSAREAAAAATAGLNTARANLAVAQGQRDANEALVRGSTEDTDPSVQAAKAAVDAAKLDLERTVLRAPVDGIVTGRQVQLGQRVAQGQPVMSIVPISQLYVEANFKEGQLRRVRVGQPATVVTDLYGSGVVYHGKVAGLGGGTGASTALIPAQNATGNWIKVVQRLPVRIVLDPKELAAHPLRVGLSSEVEIDLSGS
jgi:membrane fusion protein (multidrug efflux system)